MIFVCDSRDWADHMCRLRRSMQRGRHQAPISLSSCAIGPSIPEVFVCLCVSICFYVFICMCLTLRWWVLGVSFSHLSVFASLMPARPPLHIHRYTHSDTDLQTSDLIVQSSNQRAGVSTSSWRRQSRQRWSFLMPFLSSESTLLARFGKCFSLLLVFLFVL
jgi:hypothetical protein